MNVGLFIPLCIFCVLVVLLLCFGDVDLVLPFRLSMNRVFLGNDLILDDLLSVCLRLGSLPDCGVALGMVVILLDVLGGTFDETFFFEDVPVFVQSRISAPFNFLSFTYDDLIKLDLVDLLILGGLLTCVR